MRANAKQKEPEIQKFWTSQKVYEKLIEENSGEPYTLHDGPPYANGDLHCGHALNKVSLNERFIILIMTMPQVHTHASCHTAMAWRLAGSLEEFFQPQSHDLFSANFTPKLMEQWSWLGFQEICVTLNIGTCCHCFQNRWDYPTGKDWFLGMNGCNWRRSHCRCKDCVWSAIKCRFWRTSSIDFNCCKAEKLDLCLAGIAMDYPSSWRSPFHLLPSVSPPHYVLWLIFLVRNILVTVYTAIVLQAVRVIIDPISLGRKALQSVAALTFISRLCFILCSNTEIWYCISCSPLADFIFFT